MTVEVWNIAASLASLDLTIRDNDSHLDTEYKGVEFTATKRFSREVADAGRLHDRQERGRIWRAPT